MPASLFETSFDQHHLFTRHNPETAAQEDILNDAHLASLVSTGEHSLGDIGMSQPDISSPADSLRQHVLERAQIDSPGEQPRAYAPHNPALLDLNSAKLPDLTIIPERDASSEMPVLAEPNPEIVSLGPTTVAEAPQAAVPVTQETPVHPQTETTATQELFPKLRSIRHAASTTPESSALQSLEGQERQITHASTLTSTAEEPSNRESRYDPASAAAKILTSARPIRRAPSNQPPLTRGPESLAA